VEQDADADAVIRPNGGVPLIYGVLKYFLKPFGYSTSIFGYDWRKNLEESAEILEGMLRGRLNQPSRPLHIIAHSQGSLVARLALQRLGAATARQIVSRLVLLGPATAGSFSAVTALSGNHRFLSMIQDWGIEPPADFTEVLQSLSGIYQLIPWRQQPSTGGSGTGPAPGDTAIDWVKANSSSMTTDPPTIMGYTVDSDRLKGLFGWAKQIDTTFFADRTTIILGDSRTVVGVEFSGGKLADRVFSDHGDGTVPDSLALVDGVTSVYKALGAEHMKLPLTTEVLWALREILAGRAPSVDRFLGAGRAFPVLRKREPAAKPKAPTAAAPVAAGSAPPAPSSSLPGTSSEVGSRRFLPEVPKPTSRQIRVFSFDPLSSTDLDMLGVDQILVSLPWDFTDGDRLLPGPIGEYVEVVDVDPASGCAYAPIDLNHPHLLAQGGLPASEGDPRFHQQMAFAVSMSTINHFEIAQGRRALWSPRLERGPDGKVVSIPGEALDRMVDREYVGRLRIFPHAMRQANAYYHPDKKALLFGYFPSNSRPGDKVMPGGIVFTCMSFDVVAHETTHALLDGVHRYFTEPSNPDVFAFHEAFADIVSLFQHFSHPEVLTRQLSMSKGDLRGDNNLGTLAAQFGEAMGQHQALRSYLGRKRDDGVWETVKPDPQALSKMPEAHDRGAILVAALFRAFANIYELRVRDLKRIALGGAGVVAEGDLHPDLIARMASEASKSARHMLNICVRAIDYMPPVDVTFGDYLRAMITADHDLVRDDDLRYRVAILSAFRDWGIYPRDVNSLSIDNLLWEPPLFTRPPNLAPFFEKLDPSTWDLRGDRKMSYLQMRKHSIAFHQWLLGDSGLSDDDLERMGLVLRDRPGARVPSRIRKKADGSRVFEVHSFRPCRRIGPDGQQRLEYVVEVVQKRKGFLDLKKQSDYDSDPNADPTAREDFPFRGGCSLLIDPFEARVRYCVSKSILSESRLNRERAFRQGKFGDAVGQFYFAGDKRRSPFAALHSSC
jgi:pimeloyl-ACP methyl ester carboxylesterase